MEAPRPGPRRGQERRRGWEEERRGDTRGGYTNIYRFEGGRGLHAWWRAGQTVSAHPAPPRPTEVMTRGPMNSAPPGATAPPTR